MRQKQLPLVIVCDMLTYSNFKTKKMYSKFRNGNCSNIVGYTPPTLHKGVRWFVDFTAWDPARDAMRRKRCYIKDSLSVLAKKHRASEIIAALTKLLSQGWNPWVTNDESRGFVLFDNCLEHFSEYVERMDRKRHAKTILQESASSESSSRSKPIPSNTPINSMSLFARTS